MDERWGILGSSPPIRRLVEEIRVLAPLDATVLITGETGTGKGLAARALHAASGRRAEPFVHLDCAALAPGLIESELFGHERGAFTGAHRSQCGRLERAGRGTLFLDEVGELAPALQAKLLRVLQDRRFERVGGATPLRFEARVVAATHRDLEAAVAAGEFRADLFYRLHVVGLAVPALREHLADLDELATAMLGHPPGAALLAELGAHDWPGNVRELASYLERHRVRAALAAVGARVADRAPARYTAAGGAVQGVLAPGTARASSEQAEMPGAPLLERTLREVGGNVSRAARRLGVARTTLRRRIDRYGLGELIPRD